MGDGVVCLAGCMMCHKRKAQKLQRETVPPNYSLRGPNCSLLGQSSIATLQFLSASSKHSLEAVSLQFTADSLI